MVQASSERAGEELRAPLGAEELVLPPEFHHSWRYCYCAVLVRLAKDSVQVVIPVEDEEAPYQVEEAQRKAAQV